MLKFEAKLIDPSADEVVQTLSAAAAGANKRCRARKLADDPAKWRKFARTVAGSAEGFEMFRGGRGGTPASQVVGAWWTDPLGRKHVVFRGRRVEEWNTKVLLSRETLETRTPLWHAYPEYIYLRHVGAKAEWVCACGCGAVGTPEALGWMGECCGPCFDRREEHGPDALRSNQPGWLHGDRDALWNVAVTPDGRFVAAREGNSLVHFWDVAGRTHASWSFGQLPLADIAFTRDGRHLAAVGMLYPDIGLFAAFDTSATPPARVENESRVSGFRLVPLRHPGRMLVHRAGSDVPRVEVVTVPQGETVAGLSYALPPDIGGDFSVSPDERLLAMAGGGRVLVLELGTWRRVADLTTGAAGLAFTGDGSRLLVADGLNVVAYDTGTWKEAAEGSTFLFQGWGKTAPLSAYTRLTSVVVPADGLVVYAADESGRVYAFDPSSLALKARFDWHLSRVSRLAVTADGATLFSAGTDGVVKVWPIRRLLPEA